MADYRVVIPILNQRVIGFVGPSWQIAPNASIETIFDEDHAAFLREPPFADEPVAITSKVINLKTGAAKPTKEEVIHFAAVSQFCLNFFSTEPGACLAWAATVAPGRRGQMSVVEAFDLSMPPMASVARRKPFKFDKSIKRPFVTALHDATMRASNSFPGTMMALNRFCRALSRDDNHDRLVDLCISLESLLDGSNELRFRFSQLHAILGEADTSKRVAAFKMFQNFYDARSKVVHGDPSAQAKVDAVEREWEGLLGYAKKSLAYYVAFLGDGNDRAAWNEHVRNVCLGVEKLRGA